MIVKTGEFYVLRGKDEEGPFTNAEVLELWKAGELTEKHKWASPGMGEWKGISDFLALQRKEQVQVKAADTIDVPNKRLVDCPDCGKQVSRLAVACPGCGRPINAEAADKRTVYVQPMGMAKNRGVYVILGLLFGFFGFHNFYAGFYGRGAAQLVFCVIGAIGLTSEVAVFLLVVLVLFVWVVTELMRQRTDGDGLRMR